MTPITINREAVAAAVVARPDHERAYAGDPTYTEDRYVITSVEVRDHTGESASQMMEVSVRTYDFVGEAKPGEVCGEPSIWVEGDGTSNRQRLEFTSPAALRLFVSLAAEAVRVAERRGLLAGGGAS